MKITTYRGNEASVESMNEKGELKFALILDGRKQPISSSALNERELGEIRKACSEAGAEQAIEKAQGYLADPNIENIREEILDEVDSDEWDAIDGNPDRFMAEADKAKARIRKKEGSTPEERAAYEAWKKEWKEVNDRIKEINDKRYMGQKNSLELHARKLELMNNKPPEPRDPDPEHVSRESEGEIEVEVKPKKSKKQLQAEAKKAWEKEDKRLVAVCKEPDKCGFSSNIEALAGLMRHRRQG